MNLLQILGFEDINLPNHDNKAVLVKSASQSNGGKCVSNMLNNHSYRKRSSPIVCSNDGCSIKRIKGSL